MRELEFKILMHDNHYVDANLLEKGIYTCYKPFIYSKDETIEKMVERGQMLKDITGICYIPDKYFDMLKQCQLVSVLIGEIVIAHK